MKLSLNRGKSNLIEEKTTEAQDAQPIPNTPEPVMGEIVSAIGLALSIYMQDIHDYEKAVITMQKVMRPYSPWSSKIYGIRERPLHIPRSRR